MSRGAKRAGRRLREVGLAIACVAAVPYGLARADGGARKPAHAAELPAPSRLPRNVFDRLKSGDPALMRSALDDVRMTGKGGAAAVPVIVSLLEKGLSADLTQAAIDTLADTESPAASDVLAVYARHRTLPIRKAAVQALAKTRSPAAVKALRAALADPDPAVRGLAATSLGGANAHEALGDLFVALDRGIVEAAVSIGELCVGGECEKLAGRLGSLPLDVVTSGLDEALFRPASEVPDDMKVKLVERLRDVGTGQANRFLRQVQGRMRAGGSVRVKQAVDAAVGATNLSPGSHGGPQ